MIDINTYLEYDIAEKIEIMKLTDFASNNNYIMYDSVSLYDNSVIFVFIELLSIDDCKTVIKIDENSYLRLLLGKKLAEYVIGKVENESK